MKIVGIIPARGGSQRIKHKNIKMFGDKPLIAHTIISAKNSKKLDKVIVYTDDPNIAEIAKHYGAEVPFLEPTTLALGIGGIELPIRDAYEKLQKIQGYKADAIALLMATNPLRQTFHIDEAISIFQNKECDSVVSVCETPANHTPYWTLTVSNEKGIRLFGDRDIKDIHDRSQDFPQKCYARNDLIYVFKPENLYEEKPRLYGNRIELHKANPRYEVDINDEYDWEIAEIRLQKIKEGKIDDQE